MDNLVFAIAAPRRFWRKAYHGNSVIQRVFQALSGVAGFIITGGRFGSYSVAGFNHNRWPVWVGIRNNKQIVLLFTPTEYSKEISSILDVKSHNRYELKRSADETKIEVLRYA
jgi:hypothetical protein